MTRERSPEAEAARRARIREGMRALRAKWKAEDAAVEKATGLPASMVYVLQDAVRMRRERQS